VREQLRLIVPKTLVAWAWAAMVANSFCSPLAGATQRRLSRGRQTRHQGSQRASESHAAWGGDPVRAQNVEYSVEVEADANQSEIQELIRYTDRVAEISNSLRLGAEVKLVGGRAFTKCRSEASTTVPRRERGIPERY